MKVLVIGYSKTGTKSMHAALHFLGYKVYDFDHNFYHLRKQWLKILSEEGGTKEDFYNMYKDVDATMDIPVCNFWEEVLEAFPDIKLIFNERNSEDEWWESLKRTWDNITKNPAFRLIAILSPTAISMFRYCSRVGAVCFGGPPAGLFSACNKRSPNVAKMIYRNHNARIKEKAPKDQLLVFKPSAGWEPLCKFLGKAIPDCKFPHKNKGGTMIDEFLAESPAFQRMKLEAVISLSLILCLMVLALIYCTAF